MTTVNTPTTPLAAPKGTTPTLSHRGNAFNPTHLDNGFDPAALHLVACNFIETALAELRKDETDYQAVYDRVLTAMGSIETLNIMCTFATARA